MPRNEVLSYLDVESFDKDWKNVTKRALYAGALSSVASYFLMGETGNVKVLDSQLFAPLAIGASVAVGSIGGDYLSDAVTEKFTNMNPLIATWETNAIKLLFLGLHLF